MASNNHPVTVLERAWHAQGSNGTAAVLALGTSKPVNCVSQDEYPDWYFRVTKSEHLVELKDKMKRICDKSGITKRYLHHTEEMIERHPEFLHRALPSLSARLEIAADAVVELAVTAAEKAIAEWGCHVTDLTHLIFTTNSGAASPGADLRVATILGLRPTVQRTLLYHHGCSAGSAGLRLAKDLAENNFGARVLVVCVEVNVFSFQAPDATQLDTLIGMALFGDGAGAAIVGAGPVSRVERPIFHMVFASQVTLPGTEDTVRLVVSESGMDIKMAAGLPKLVGDSIKQCLEETLAPFGGLACDWNELFWAAHPGGRAILDGYQAACGLEPRKMAASRRVLSEYGNMLGTTIFFVLDEMRCRRQSADQGESENCQWGVLLGLGPGITIEMMVLHATGIRDDD